MSIGKIQVRMKDAKIACGLRNTRRIDIECVNCCPAIAEPLCNGAANPLRGAADHGDTVRELQ